MAGADIPRAEPDCHAKRKPLQCLKMFATLLHDACNVFGGAQ